LRDIRFKDKSYRLDRRLLFAVLLAAEGAIFWLDIITGPLISFSPYYIIIIALSTWFIGRSIAILFIILSSLLRVYVFSSILPESFYYYAYDIFQSILVYSTFEILITKIKNLIERLSVRTDLLESRVSHLDTRNRLDATIRRATPEDINGIMVLANSAAKSGVLDINIETPERQKDLATQFRKWIEDGYFVRRKWNGEEAEVTFELWVSIMNNEFAGFSMITGIDGKLDIKRELHLIVIGEAFRGMGLGSAMLDFFCKHYANHQLFVASRPRSRMWEMLMKRRFTKFSNATHGYIIFSRSV
jgi:ribosomal protein S18 acetylase RimI-like enzyme